MVDIGRKLRAHSCSLSARLRIALVATSLAALGPACMAAAQTYEEIERQTLRQIEQENARQIGDCSEAMLGWLGLRFTEEERRRGKARVACADAQRVALRNRVPFLQALPHVAIAHGGTQTPECPSAVTPESDYGIYSGCRIRPVPLATLSPSVWDLERRREVEQLGAAVLVHLTRCISSSCVGFAFTVRDDGRIENFGDAGAYGRSGPDRNEALELTRIERTLRVDARWNVFPEALRGRYISIANEGGRLKVQQVRDEKTASWLQHLAPSTAD